MAIKTGIQWCDSTWNPWQGCHKVSTGCKNCYMYRDMVSYGKNPNLVFRSSPQTFNMPLAWQRKGELHSGARIFVCSWSDFFVQEADYWRDEAWDIIKKCSEFNFLIPTKRIERASLFLPEDWGDGYKNVWLGVSAENQEMYNKRVPVLASIPAHIRWVSAEPLIDSIDPTQIPESKNMDWFVSGGESGNSPRPANIQWYRILRGFCEVNKILYFHKQNGGSKKIDGGWGGRTYDNHLYEQFPG